MLVLAPGPRNSGFTGCNTSGQCHHYSFYQGFDLPMLYKLWQPFKDTISISSKMGDQILGNTNTQLSQIWRIHYHVISDRHSLFDCKCNTWHQYTAKNKPVDQYLHTLVYDGILLPDLLKYNSRSKVKKNPSKCLGCEA